MGTRFSGPSSLADSRAGRTQSIDTPRPLTDLRVTRQSVRFPRRSTWRSSPCLPRVLRRSSRNAGLHTWAPQWVLSFGFGETGPSGAATQSQVLASARRHDVRLVGPNCIGLTNTDPFIRLNATFAATSPLPGHLAVASQSGAVGVAILDSAERSGVGISTFVSLGNKIDVSTNDLLSYWYDDLTTRAVALYVESFGNPRRFTWLARALSTRKPILAVKSGRSVGGRRAGMSHTAAAAAPDVAVDSLFRQAGVLRMDTLGELLDTARLLTEQPLPAGDRVVIVGNAGGLNVLAADAAAAAKLQIVELSGSPSATAGRRCAAFGRCLQSSGSRR